MILLVLAMIILIPVFDVNTYVSEEDEAQIYGIEATHLVRVCQQCRLFLFVFSSHRVASADVLCRKPRHVRRPVPAAAAAAGGQRRAHARHHQ